MIKKYIKGNENRSAEIINILENLGGKNTGITLTFYDCIYFINRHNEITFADKSFCIYDVIIECFEEIKLPETPTEKQLPKNWEEWVKLNPIINEEYYINIISEVKCQLKGERLNRDCCNLKTKEDAEGLLALIKLKRLMDTYNDGWKPDWSDKTFKYSIDYIYEELKIVDFTFLHRFLTFKTKELAEEFLKNFRDLIKQAKMWL